MMPAVYSPDTIKSSPISNAVCPNSNWGMPNSNTESLHTLNNTSLGNTQSPITNRVRGTSISKTGSPLVNQGTSLSNLWPHHIKSNTSFINTWSLCTNWGIPFSNSESSNSNNDRLLGKTELHLIIRDK